MANDRRLIDATEEAKWVHEHVLDATERNIILDFLRDCTTVDADPVRHERWDDSGKYRFEDGAIAIRCSRCGCALTVEEYRKFQWNYCPVCGARMDGGADNG